MPKFEVFTRRMTPSSNAPSVTIQKRGTISLNKASFDALGKPDAIELLYDRTARIVGLRPAEPGTPQAYPLRPGAGVGHGPYVVSAIAFTKFYEIPTDKSLRWQAQLVEGVLCVELDSIATEVTSNRAAGSTASRPNM